MSIRLVMALDILPLERVKTLCQDISSLVDVVEVGTPLIIQHGLGVVGKVREWTGEDVPLFVDTKIVDAGKWETREAAQAGAQLVSVLAGASEVTLREVQETALEVGVNVVVDSIDLSSSDRAKVDIIGSLRPEFVCLHLSSDEAGKGERLSERISAHPLGSVEAQRIMVAGGIGPATLPALLSVLRPALVVVGSALTGSDTPEKVVAELRRVADEY